MGTMIGSVLIVFFLLNSLALSEPCYPRTYQFGGIVCVCNSSHCDTLDVEKSASHGNILTYESNLAGKRFEKKIVPLESVTQLTSPTTYQVTVNITDFKQEIFGFGGSVSDAAAINILALPEGLSNRLVQDYFGPNGLEYNMARVPIGCTDFSPRNYSYDEEANDFDLEKFSLAEEDNNYKIPVIKLAQKSAKQLKLLGSLWTAPIWMKTNSHHNGMGILKGNPGKDYYRTLANYHVKFLNAYKKESIKFWGLTTVNEPTGGLKPHWINPCLGMSPEMIRDWIKFDLGPVLRSSGYTKESLQLIIHDEIISSLPYYVNAILRDDETNDFVTGIGLHWYESGYEPYEPLNIIHDKHPDKFILSTEACEGWAGSAQGVQLGNWTRAETYSWDIINVLNHWVTGWIDWNLALNLNGGPNHMKNIADSPVIVNAASSEYYKQPMFYALGHFSKFLSSGSKRLGFTDNIDDPMIRLTVFKDLQSQIVAILLNRRDQLVEIDLNGLHSKPIRVKLNPRSITTMILQSS